MKDMDFPTIDPADPYRLTEEEEQVVERLRHAFVHCEKLQRHVRFHFFQGKPVQGIQFQPSLPRLRAMDEEGNFLKVNVYGKEYSGKEPV